MSFNYANYLHLCLVINDNENDDINGNENNDVLLRHSSVRLNVLTNFVEASNFMFQQNCLNIKINH